MNLICGAGDLLFLGGGTKTADPLDRNINELALKYARGGRRDDSSNIVGQVLDSIAAMQI
jgi:hypothetical protein